VLARPCGARVRVKAATRTAAGPMLRSVDGDTVPAKFAESSLGPSLPASMLVARKATRLL
jgi:hypothetical protein